MIKPAMKRALRKVAGRIQEILQRPEEEDSERRSFDQDHFVYPWLNAVFTNLLREHGHVLYPAYTWGVLHGAHLAKSLGIDRVSVIEFGVSGGRGLLCLDRLAAVVPELLGVKVDAYGFDTGVGLPKPTDVRDMPNLYREGTYRMEVEKLKARLQRSELLLGLVEQTVPKFIQSGIAPIAFVSIDLDYYSSTVHALKILEADDPHLLPRVHCYFDDILAFTCSEFTGERLAIAEFNAAHSTRKLSPIYGLKYFLPPAASQQQWSEMFYLAHIFDHPLYGEHDGLVKNPSTPL